MKKLLAQWVPILIFTLIAWLLPSEVPRAVPDALESCSSDLLPESTAAAVEIRDLSRRWHEMRQIPAVAQIQDRVLSALGLEAEDLRSLAGDRAVLALVRPGSEENLRPIGLLRPQEPSDAAALLERAAGAHVVRSGPDLLWLLPDDLSDRFDPPRYAQPSSRRVQRELDRRLPAGGLVRGWINPDVLRESLRHRVEGVHPAPAEWLASLAAVELEAVRFAGFRRDLSAQGIVTDAVVVYALDRLPPEVARTFDPRTAPVRLPAELPAGMAAMAAFRTETGASLAFLRHAARRDPRGPLRNLEFWIDAFDQRMDRDLERDLRESIGERAWAMVFEDDRDDPPRVVVAIEVEDGKRLERALIDLRSFFMEHTLGRSLGLVVPSARDQRRAGLELHGMTLRSPLGSIESPVFAVTDRYLLLATADRAIDDGLRLLAERPSWTPVAVGGGLPSPAHVAARLRVGAIAAWLEALLDPHGEGAPAGSIEAIGAHLDTATLGGWYEEDALRIRTRVRFASR